MPDKEYLTITGAANEKNCSRSTIYQMIKKGKVNIYEVAGKQFVVKDDVFLKAEISRGVPFKALEERLNFLEEKVVKLEVANEKLEQRLASLESERRSTRKRGS